MMHMLLVSPGRIFEHETRGPATRSAFSTVFDSHISSFFMASRSKDWTHAAATKSHAKHLGDKTPAKKYNHQGGFGWTNEWHDAHITHICKRLDILEGTRTNRKKMPVLTFSCAPFVRKDMNSPTAKKVHASASRKYRGVKSMSLASRPDNRIQQLQSSRPLSARHRTSTSTLATSTAKSRRPLSACQGKKQKRAKFVKHAYEMFVKMLAEHYSSSEYDSILRKVADEAKSLQEDMIRRRRPVYDTEKVSPGIDEQPLDQ